MGKINFSTFINDWMWPTFAVIVFGVALVAIVRNIEALVDKKGVGTQKDALIDMAWLIGGLIVGLAVLGGIVTLLQNKPNFNF